MEKTEGFIVVQKSLIPGEARNNRRYRGIDRLIPWSMERYRAGFDDPYLSSEYATNEGLIQTLHLAQKVLLIFTQIMDPNNLEILYARGVPPTKEFDESPIQQGKFLGFDVAGNSSPFYSLVSDFPPPDEASFQVFIEELNENGLFRAKEVARDYLEAYLKQYPEEHDKGIIVWEIFLIQQEAERT